MSGQRTIAEKLEILEEWEKEGWSSTYAAKHFEIARGTLCGWRDAKEDLRAAAADPSTKRIAKPGPPPPTADYEGEIVDLIQLCNDIGESMTRSDIIAACEERIPGFVSRGKAAKQSWTTRFITRNQLESAVVRVKKVKTSTFPETSGLSTLPEKSSLSTLPETSGLSTLPENSGLSTLPETSGLSTLPETSGRSTLPENSGRSTLPESHNPPTSPQKRTKSATAAKKQKQSDASTFDSASRLSSSKKKIGVSTLGEKTNALGKKTDGSSLGKKPNPSGLADAPDGCSSSCPIAVEDLCEDNAGFDDTRGDVICSTNAVCFLAGTSSRRLVVQQKDLDRLDPGKWVGDVVMSFYIREHTVPYGPTFNFDCQFFRFIHLAYTTENRNMRVAFEKCGGITATFPWEKYQFVVIPIWMNYHWSFAVMQNPVEYFQTKTHIIHVDSTSLHDTATVVKVLGGYFAEEKLRNGGKSTRRNGGTFESRPRQLKPTGTIVVSLFCILCARSMSIYSSPRILARCSI